MLLNLKIRIIEKFRTQADFAMESKNDESYVSRIVCGRRKLSPSEQQRWAELLGSDVKTLFLNRR